MDDVSEVLDRELDGLPPSAKLVAKVLEIEAPLTQGELGDRTLLPDRTVRYALSRLDEVELLESQYSIRDARKQVYALKYEGTRG